MRTTAGLRRVDVIYRRVDDDFLDPLAFRADSHLGVAGLLNAYRAGHVSIANAIGTGVADDKARLRLRAGDDPVLSVGGADPSERRDVSAGQSCRPAVTCSSTSIRWSSRRWGSRVATACWSARTARGQSARSSAAESWPTRATSSRSRRSRCRERACFLEEGIEPRHVDLRPYVLYGERAMVVPGGLTRVALRKGSLVVNSSQGGGSKDTWVLLD